jgi:hypothetical protein
VKEKEAKVSDVYIKRISDPPIKEPEPEISAQACFERMTVDSDYYPIYTMDYKSPIEYIPRQSKVNIRFWCPGCTGKFNVDLIKFRLSDKLTCFCGTRLEFDEPDHWNHGFGGGF